MKFEYLIFNLIVFSGPIFFGIQKKFNFTDKFKPAIISIFLTSLPFLIWDSLVTDIHWRFNENFTIGIKLFSLPIEEIMFFYSVPLACLFLWEMIIQNSKDKVLIENEHFRFWGTLLLISSVVFVILGKIYTSFVFLSVFLAFFIDSRLTKLYKRKNFWVFISMIAGFILLFNGYLTARPVVLYSPDFMVNFRIITIPVEDFGYGFSLIYFAIIVYEKLKKIFNVREKTISTK